jgi:hypothetical protein
VPGGSDRDERRALGACLLVLVVAVALDRRPYRPDLMAVSYAPKAVVAVAAAQLPASTRSAIRRAGSLDPSSPDRAKPSGRTRSFRRAGDVVSRFRLDVFSPAASHGD